MEKKTGFYAFILLAVLICVMAWATLDRQADGNVHVLYNSVWFSLLWILMATVGSYFISISWLHKRLPVFLLHIAFLVILSGALTTRLTGSTGQIHLRENQLTSSFFDEWTHRKIVFPFSLSLKSFEIEYYPGTTSPANYTSIVELTGAKTGETVEHEISMNNILRYKGYRFYQSSFDEDWKGSILSVNHDPWGILLSYIGYFLMFFSMLWILFDKRERFHFLLKKLAQKAILPVLLLSFATDLLGFQNPPAGLESERNLPDLENPAGFTDLGSQWVDYHGRISPIQTLANDFTSKLTGKNSYQSLSGEQFFFGWLFFPDQWKQEPVFKLKSAELKRIAGSQDDYASLADFIDADGRNKLEPYYRQMYGSNKPEGWLKEAVMLDDKFHLVEMLQNGSLLKIFPMKDNNGKLQWYAPNMDMPVQADSTEIKFVKNFLSLYYEALVHGDAATLSNLNTQLSTFQKKAGDALPSATQLKMEQIYNRTQIFSALFKICLVMGFLCLLFFIFSSVFNNSKIQGFWWMERFFDIALWIVFAACTAGLGLRTFIGGRLPLSNGYETMLLLTWFSLLTGILARRYSFLIVAFSFLMAGFTLLVAHISSMNPQITPLVPVLQSPLLTIHVLMIMVAYGLCGFMALNSLTALVIWLIGKKITNRTEYILKMKETGELFMYPATFLLGAGIFIGAIWANISWGRYWGWDPKEVWALVTFLLMSFTFHDKTLTWFRKPLFYHAFVLLIFIAVLMTYFGVNYLLGGKHSYA